MTKEEFETLEKACEGIIPMESINSVIKWKKTKEELENILDECLQEEDSNNRFEVLLTCTPTNMNKKEEEELYRKYLLSQEHFLHEYLATSFQTYFNESSENVNTLISAIENIPEYQSHDDCKYPYIRKCIYAIGAQPEPFNFNGLNKLLNSKDKEIVELTKHQIEKRKEVRKI